MSGWVTWVAALTATGLVTGLVSGCVSSSTWGAWSDVDRALAREEGARERAREREREPAAAPSTEPASGCEALALRIAQSHPGLRAPRERARAALARARAEGALPAPQAAVGVWDFPIGDPQLADRQGMYMLRLAQELPPAGLLDGRARARVEEARESVGELDEMERMLRARAAHACTDWAQAATERARIDASRSLLEQVRAVRIARLASSTDALAELARIDGELARLERDSTMQSSLQERAAAQLRALWGRRDPLPEPPPLAPPPPTGDVDALVTRALASRGLVTSAQARVRAAAARASAAEASATVPTFGVSATYMQMPSNRPGIGAEVMMTLPWLWSGEGAERDAARLDAEAELDTLAGLERDVRAEVVSAAHTLEAARRTLEVLQARERPAAERALEAASATYATGGVDLVTWLDAARALRELEVEEARLLGGAAHARVELEAAVGTSLEEAGR
ncbi:MAG: TolC family protein [Sandaracinaceae bacterium]|nr:TolC family protein [Sandaracinaceae bacterium]